MSSVGLSRTTLHRVHSRERSDASLTTHSLNAPNVELLNTCELETRLVTRVDRVSASTSGTTGVVSFGVSCARSASRLEAEFSLESGATLLCTFNAYTLFPFSPVDACRKFRQGFESGLETGLWLDLLSVFWNAAGRALECVRVIDTSRI